jgi:hypothetical protein
VAQALAGLLSPAVGELMLAKDRVWRPSAGVDARPTKCPNSSGELQFAEKI